MIIVGTDTSAVEADMVGGRIFCPNRDAGLQPCGHGTEREVAGWPRPCGAGCAALASGPAP